MVHKSSALNSDAQETDARGAERGKAHKRAWLLRAVAAALAAQAHSTGSTASTASTSSPQARSPQARSGQARSTCSGQAGLTIVPADDDAYRANGLEAVDRHLSRLLAAVREPGVPQILQVLDGICDGCQGCPQNAMVCPLQTCGTCIVLRDADTILNALAEALWEVQDPEYVQNHPGGL